MKSMNDYINKRIQDVVASWNPSDEPSEISKLISFGELVDKLAICNLKLFKLKDLQAELKPEDASIVAMRYIKQDITLCKERSQIKRAIDQKLREIIKSQLSGKDDFVAEEKLYGDDE
jgi:hypothetical protein